MRKATLAVVSFVLAEIIDAQVAGNGVGGDDGGPSTWKKRLGDS